MYRYSADTNQINAITMEQQHSDLQGTPEELQRFEGEDLDFLIL